MTIPAVEESDLQALSGSFPDLDFSDEERRAVLLKSGSFDVQAAPGSGKTTLLAVKLLLLAGKWPYSNRGICVLSHTNVARDEIAARLRKTAVGSRLLVYPHFLGTIHAFVNQFLALPLLRSCGRNVDVVDNDVFAARALAGLKRKYHLRNWVSINERQRRKAVASLRYEGANLELGWADGKLPGAGTPSHAQARELKEELTQQGVFRHDDMFAFGEKLLAIFPAITERVSWRFPLLLIDEMQDTSWAQEAILGRAFNASVAIQRYGDRNQRILVSEENANKLTYPRPGSLQVTSTKRFPEHIAAAVRAVQEHGQPIKARALFDGYRPVLILYDTASVQKVIDQFGSVVLSTMPDDVIGSDPVMAVCARKQGSAKKAPGRHLGDYWPEYRAGATTPSGQESVRRLLAAPQEMGIASLNLDQRSRNIRRAVLLCLRLAGSSACSGMRDSYALERALGPTTHEAQQLRALCRDLVLARDLTKDADSWGVALARIYDGLLPLLPKSLSADDFRALLPFEGSLAQAAAPGAENEHIVQKGGRTLRIGIGTIASVKGETHAATLVLESYCSQSRRFDLENALPNLAGRRSVDSGASESLRAAYRNLYVAMSRPRHLLCAAMNKERITAQAANAIVQQGWLVVEI